MKIDPCPICELSEQLIKSLNNVLLEKDKEIEQLKAKVESLSQIVRTGVIDLAELASSNKLHIKPNGEGFRVADLDRGDHE